MVWASLQRWVTVIHVGFANPKGLQKQRSESNNTMYGRGAGDSVRWQTTSPVLRTEAVSTSCQTFPQLTDFVFYVFV